MNTLQFTHNTVRMMGLHVLAVYMLLRCAEEEGIAPVQHQWIVDHMPPKTGPNTVTAALRWLTNPEHQIAIRVTGGWRLNKENSFQLPLTYLVNENHSQRDSETRITPSAIPEGENHSQRDSSFVYPLTNYLIDVNDSNESIDSLTLTTSAENRAESENHSQGGFSTEDAPGLSADEVKARLQVLGALGIIGDKAKQIATDHHITLEAVRAHVLLAKSEEWARPLGMAIYRLLHYVPAPDIKANGHVVGCKCEECHVSNTEFDRYQIGSAEDDEPSRSFCKWQDDSDQVFGQNHPLAGQPIKLPFCKKPCKDGSHKWCEEHYAIGVETYGE